MANPKCPKCGSTNTKPIGSVSMRKENEITDSKNRNDVIGDFINKGVQMLSNFGLHHGTYASQEEARLARDVTVALATYVGTSKNLRDVKLV